MIKSKGSLGTVFLVVLIDLLGFGIVLPLLPFYASEFQVGPLAIGLLYSIYSGSQLIFSPIWGSLSDKIGRRPVMLISTFGASISYLIFAFAPSYAILFVSRMLAGIMGGNISAAQAYIADVTPPEDRARGMGIIGAAFGIGFVIGPALATGLMRPELAAWVSQAGLSALGSVLENHKFEVPGIFAACMSLLSFVMVLAKLPETVEKGNPSQNVQRRGIFTIQFWNNLIPGKTKYVLIPTLLLVSLILWTGQGTLYSAFPLFCENKLGMSAGDVGIQFFYLGLISAVVQGGLIRPLTRVFREETLFLIGTFLLISGMASFVLVESQSSLMWTLLLLALGNSLNLPTLNSLISQQCDPKEVGAMLGTSQSVAGIGRVVGPTWGGWLFTMGATVPFIATSFLLLPALGIAFYIMLKTKNQAS